MWQSLHVKYPLFLSALIKFEFPQQIFEKSSNIKFIKLRPVAAKMFHAERQTDRQTGMTKLTVGFRNFANARNNEILIAREGQKKKQSHCHFNYHKSHMYRHWLEYRLPLWEGVYYLPELFHGLHVGLTVTKPSHEGYGYL